MTLKELFGTDYKYNVNMMLKLKADRDPVHTAIEVIAEEKDILEFLTDYIEWVKYQKPEVDPIVYAILKTNHMLEKTDGVFKNYNAWKSVISSKTHMTTIQA